MPIAVTTPTRTARQLLDRIFQRQPRTTAATRAATAPRTATSTGTPGARAAARDRRHAAEARRRADEHMRDNAAQTNPLGLR
ncbi:hypothetical protein [Isoptericola rhizosphaerae]|uniref:hypothetical protein n=1 Tax=Isoptericola rhizosphaerae TaxID=3377837 RepID=UPI00383B20DC